MAALKVFTVSCILISASLQVFASPRIIRSDSKLGNEVSVKPSDYNRSGSKKERALFSSEYQMSHDYVPGAYTTPEEVSWMLPASTSSQSESRKERLDMMKSFGEEYEHQEAEEWFVKENRDKVKAFEN